MHKPDKIFFNGNILERNQIDIEISDRGFRFGDGVFETIRVYKSKPYLLNEHIARMMSGLKSILINSESIEAYDFQHICQDLIRLNYIENGVIRIMISRGVGSFGYLPKDDISPTVIIETEPREFHIPSGDCKLWLTDIRKIPSECLPVNYKLANGLNSTLAKMDAKKNSCYDSILLNLDETIAETSSANIFWFRDDTLFTPERDCNPLLGIIRQRVIELSPYKVVEGRFKLSDINQAEEVFITNTAILVLRVTSLEPSLKMWNDSGISRKFLDIISNDMES